MYYITNQNGQIIAASSDLLALLQVDSIEVLYKKIALDAIELTAEEKDIIIKTPLDEAHYKKEEEILLSLLGEMTLIRLTEKISGEIGIAEELPSSVEEKEEKLLLLEKESVIPESKSKEKEEEALFEIREPADEQETSVPEAKAKKQEKVPEDDLFDLILPDNAEETIGEIEDKAVLEKAVGPIYIDVKEIAQSIGISPEDYNTFLTEYIDTALSLEDDLRSKEKSKRTAATHTLFHLSNVLRLPVVTEIIEQLKYTEDEDIESSIQSFYNTLSRLTTTKPKAAAGEKEIPIKKEIKPSEGFGTIDLSNVKPIYFDFQVEQAANELSLPAELIEEFIHDFIKQAHEETDKMLKAYEKGDLETINKIGHLLKGTASNLRITPLADTLYEIQFCEDSSQLEKLIKEYWGHFIAFETQFELTSKNKGK
ncbi:hypothetical protein YH65_02550 [Sulfurovum lithotrophicum]|uniref:HPt domain-containing protein n=1 Tax=Sulfurovum lithotrophicum TaxID=206403 RepID=A0A7U4M031_9BACT|nr:Hpt domain-containing protein [Sulfurovum lithotrophicum]AKF24398.1 hypothetical protein YH65_02550 [Sulfurovum lithotrophicum]